MIALKENNLKKLVSASLVAALACVATMVFVLPLPGNGYVNLGDCVVIAAGCLLGPLWGAAAAAIGSSLADMLLGYAVYMPGTFVIKGLMAVCACYIFHAMRKSGAAPSIYATGAASVAAEVVMLGGYFLYDTALLGYTAAAVATMGNLVQAGAGAAIGASLLHVILRSERIRVMLEQK